MSSVTGLPGTYLGQRPSAISKAAVQSGPLQTLSFSELTQYVGFPPSPSGEERRLRRRAGRYGTGGGLMSERRTSSWLVVCTVPGGGDSDRWAGPGGSCSGIVMFAPKWCPCPRPRLNLATGGLSNRSGTEQSVIQCPSLRRGLNAGEGACEHGTLTIHYLDWIRPVDDHPG